MSWNGLAERIEGILARGGLVEIMIGRSLNTAGRARIQFSGFSESVSRKSMVVSFWRGEESISIEDWLGAFSFGGEELAGGVIVRGRAVEGGGGSGLIVMVGGGATEEW